MSLFALILLISSIVVYLGYISYAYVKYKPSCISETYYLLKPNSLFTIWAIVMAFLIFPAWVEISPINFLFLPFLSIVTLSCVGLSPKYLGEDRNAHIISAILTFTISIIWNIVTGTYIIPLILLGLLLVLLILKAKNPLFWAENLAFLNIYLSILI